jgi:hypothetical protein
MHSIIPAAIFPPDFVLGVTALGPPHPHLRGGLLAVEHHVEVQLDGDAQQRAAVLDELPRAVRARAHADLVAVDEGAREGEEVVRRGSGSEQRCQAGRRCRVR